MLIFHHVIKQFDSIIAVNDLTLKIRKGEIFGLLGPNGAGKTTAVNLAVGILKPDKGYVEMESIGSPESRAVRAKIGVATQALALYDDLTGQENLDFFGRMQGIGKLQLKERVNWTLDFAGLFDRRKDRVKTYSGGMKRRLNLAIALLHSPSLLLLDEPTVGVDPQSRNAIFESIMHLNKEGHTILYTTHYIEEAQRLCDHVGILDHGKLLALDTVKNLIDKYGGESTILAEYEDREEKIQTRQPVKDLEKLMKRGSIRHFHMESPSLEGVFLKLTGKQLRDDA
ncbi:ABC transporter ATP-binding protein [bacterium]|nr:ABC transporter ATP-binding protein [bacterium]RQV95516.1 MAG: ABC transporter ATP-binding protein [bacterium]